MKTWYNSSWNEVVKKLKSDFKYGLTEDKVKESREVFGDNKNLNLKNKNFIILFFKHMLKLHCVLAIFISVLLIYINNFKAAVFLCGTTVLFVLLYAFKDYKNENRLNKLRSIAPHKADVVREGKLLTLNSEELVVGDIVYVEKGDIVPADLRIMQCENLKVKESAITGDISLVEKYETKIEDKELLPSDMKNILFKSSFVIDGSAKGIVVAVGENTEIGKMTENLLKENHERTLLEENISNIINFMSKIFILCLVGIGLYAIYGKTSLSQFINLIFIIYLTIVPVHIIFIIDILSFIIRKHMKRAEITIEGLSSMQTLSEINVLLINKVGALTKESMFVSKLFCGENIIDADLENIEENKDNVDRMITIGLLCNDANVDRDGKVYKGDITERAIIEYGRKNFLYKNVLEKEQERIFTVPYDGDKKIKTTLNRIEDKYRANVVGSVDKLLERCTHIMKNGMEVEITLKDILSIRDADLALSKEGLHVIGFAYRNFNYEPSVNENIESNLVFVGLMGLNNPLKENAIESIDYCKRLAIKPVVITEDNKIAANSFGKKIGILNQNDMVLSGVEIDNMDDGDIEKVVEKVGIYSKISSKNKWKICCEFEKLGYNVAVTGNRFTDLPSFRASKIGIAAGKECTQITKNMGDIFIKDKSFMKLLALIDKGRKLIRNINNIIFFNLVISIIEFLSITTISVFFKHMSVDFTKILWINFIGLMLNSLLIYSQSENIKESTYNRVYMDKRIFNRFTSGIILYIAYVSILLITSFAIQKNKGVAVGEESLFAILYISLIIFSFYFIEIKNVVKNKISLLIFILNFILCLLLFENFHHNYLLSLNKSMWNLKITIIFLIIEMFLVKFIKGMYNIEQ